MFERLKQAVNNFVQRAGAQTGVAREFKDIFELGGVPAFNQFYYFGIFPWKLIYKGKYNAWHLVPAPTIADSGGKRELFRLELAKASCAELAGMVWSERCDVNVNAVDFEPDEDRDTDGLGDFVRHVLQRGNFEYKMQEFVEQALALGGGALKVWYEVKRDADGAEIPGSGEIKIGYCMADQFIPTAWDNAGVTEGVFISRLARGGYYYTRLEWHKWDGLTYHITNELYRADRLNGATGEPQDILGFRFPLSAIYPFLDDDTPLDGLERSLFTYFRPPDANNLDDNSPLGISIYANALDTLHAIDICYDSFVREFKLGRKRIIVPAAAVRTVIDPSTGQERRFFDASDDVYEALSTEDPDTLRITDNTVALRVDEHVAALNALLAIYCMQTGFSPTAFSFTAAGGIKTATEVISENSKTYKTVRTVQNMLKSAVEGLIHNIIAVAMLYGVTWDGVPVASLAAGGWECSVMFDDSIVQDRQTNLTEGINLVSNGLLSKKTFMTDPKYGIGLTGEGADAELERIAAEGRVSIPALDAFDAGAE